MIDPTTHGTGLSRRRLLSITGAAGAGITIAAAMGTPAPAAPAPAAPDALATPIRTAGPVRQMWTAATTGNRWPVVGHTRVRTFGIEGSTASTTLLADAGTASDVALVLLYVARRFHYTVAPLAGDDVRGHHTDRVVSTAGESNRLSGTAISIQPEAFPAGSTGNLFPPQVRLVRSTLAACGGVVRWGGDDPTVPCEGLFHIDVPPGDSRLAQVAAKLRAWRGGHDLGLALGPAAGPAL